MSRVQRDDLGIARRAQDRIRRVNRKSVADHLLREDRIGDAFQRPSLARYRS
jgi:hypothetical protein